MAIVKEKLIFEQQYTGKTFIESVVYPKIKQMLTTLGIEYTEFGFNGKWYLAKSTHANNWTPQWLRDVNSKCNNIERTFGGGYYTDSLGSLYLSGWHYGVGKYALGDSSGSNYLTNENPDRGSTRGLYGGLTFTVDDIRYAVCVGYSGWNMQGNGDNIGSYGSASFANYTSNYLDYGFLTFVIDGNSLVASGVGQAYESKYGSFCTAMPMVFVHDVNSTSGTFYGACFRYDTFELILGRVGNSFYMNGRVAKAFNCEQPYNRMFAGHFKVLPFFDASAIGDFHYLYPLRRVTKIDQIYPGLDISKLTNLVCDRTIFNQQMHPLQGDKFLSKSPIYNWYVGYDLWGMLGRLEGIYGTVVNYGRDYVLLDGSPYQGIDRVFSDLYFGNTSVLATQ